MTAYDHVLRHNKSRIARLFQRAFSVKEHLTFAHCKKMLYKGYYFHRISFVGVCVEFMLTCVLRMLRESAVGVARASLGVYLYDARLFRR